MKKSDENVYKRNMPRESEETADVRPASLEVGVAILLMSLCLAIRFAQSLVPVDDPDLWWHLAAGRWMFEHGTIPSVDPFSTAEAGREWLNYSWSIDLAWWAGYRVIGLAAPLVYAAIFQGLLLVLCMALVYGDGSRLVRRAFVAALGFMAIGPRLPPRTYLVTFLFTGVTLLVIRAVRRGGSVRRGFWLVPMFAIWPNTHIEFFYALFFLGLSAVSELIEEWQNGVRIGRRSTELFYLTAACGAATLANPFGARLHLGIWRWMAPYLANGIISEMQAIPFRSVSDYLILTLFATAIFALAQRRNRSLYDWGVLAVSAYISFQSQRAAWMVVWVSLDLLAGLPLLSTSDAAEVPPRRFFWSLSATLAVVVAVFSAALVRRSDLLIGENLFPFAATQFARDEHLQGPLFNDFNWGGFMRFQLPETPGNIDGRGNIISVEEVVASIETWRGGPGWAKSQKLDEAGFVIANVRTALAQLLRFDSRFRVAYEDPVAVVFVRERRAE
jgi:hypothetical protein